MTQLTATEYKHIHLDAKRVPTIAGTTMKVVELVMAQRAYGWGPKQFKIQNSKFKIGKLSENKDRSGSAYAI